MKKVAWTLYSFRVSSTRGVTRSLGPSSKVRYTGLPPEEFSYTDTCRVAVAVLPALSVTV